MNDFRTRAKVRIAHYRSKVPWLFHRGMQAIIGVVAVALMRIMRRCNRERLANALGPFVRRVGPLLSEHRVGRANLAAAFPEKTPAEIDAILGGVWENLGRVGAEFVHLDHITIVDERGAAGTDIIADEATLAQAAEIQRTQGPTLFFAAHLANWELAGRFAPHFNIDSTILFRPPNIRAVRNAVIEMRAPLMGTLVPSDFQAPVQLARALQRGGAVGMLVDQYDSRGVPVTFFGRPTKAPRLLARLARQFDCPIRGLRTIRLADRNKFRGELTAPIEPVRDAEGKIDVVGTTQVITSVVESWVRENPDQWLWVHRRWR